MPNLLSQDLQRQRDLAVGEVKEIRQFKRSRNLCFMCVHTYMHAPRIKPQPHTCCVYALPLSYIPVARTPTLSAENLNLGKAENMKALEYLRTTCYC